VIHCQRYSRNDDQLDAKYTYVEEKVYEEKKRMLKKKQFGNETNKSEKQRIKL